LAIKLSSTKDAVTDNGLKLLVYGKPGAGKTYLCGTWDNSKTLIVSAEGGILTLGNKDIASVEIRSMDDLVEVFDMLESKEGDRFEMVFFDSISEVAEVCLADEKTKTKDGRKAYGEMGERMTRLIRAFRDLRGRHVVMVAKCDQVKDDNTGKLVYGPSAPGNKLSQNLPYFFDVVLAMRVEVDEAGETHRFLQAQPDGQWLAKDRSGKLDHFEEADLTAIIKKIGA
jgi:phage nucleotide-binding protein